MSEYVVIYEQADDGGWWAYSPDLPGVVAAADSRQAAEREIREALALHIEELQRSGISVPAPGSRVGTVEV